MCLRLFLFLLGVPFAVALARADPASPIVWQDRVEIAQGRGERGPWRQSESRFDYVDDPAVAVDPRGDAVVAWVDQASKAVLFQRFPAEGKVPLAPPVDVSLNPETFSWLPRLALAPDAPGRILIAWQEIIFSGGSHGGDILLAGSNDGGRTFSAPLNLSRSVGGDGKGRINRDVWHNGSLDLVAGPGGAVHVAWTEYDGPLWFSRSSNGGRTFSEPVRIAGSQRSPARAPSLALAPDGALYLAWTVGEDEGADIRLAKSVDGGRSFGQPQVVERSQTYSDAPKLAVDSTGVLHLAYAESSGGPFARHHVRYIQSMDGGERFEASREISGPMPRGFSGAAFPSLAADARGRVYVAWELYAATVRQAPRGLGLSMSHDGGRSFTAPVLVAGSLDAAGGFNGSSQGLLMKKLAVNAAGAVALVNSSLKPDSHSRVWLMRGQPQR